MVRALVCRLPTGGESPTDGQGSSGGVRVTSGPERVSVARAIVALVSAFSHDATILTDTMESTVVPCLVHPQCLPDKSSALLLRAVNVVAVRCAVDRSAQITRWLTQLSPVLGRALSVVDQSGGSASGNGFARSPEFRHEAIQFLRLQVALYASDFEDPGLGAAAGDSGFPVSPLPRIQSFVSGLESELSAGSSFLTLGRGGARSDDMWGLDDAPRMALVNLLASVYCELDCSALAIAAARAPSAAPELPSPRATGGASAPSSVPDTQPSTQDSQVVGSSSDRRAARRRKRNTEPSVPTEWSEAIRTRLSLFRGEQSGDPIVPWLQVCAAMISRIHFLRTCLHRVVDRQLDPFHLFYDHLMQLHVQTDSERFWLLICLHRLTEGVHSEPGPGGRGPDVWVHVALTASRLAAEAPDRSVVLDRALALLCTLVRRDLVQPSVLALRLPGQLWQLPLFGSNRWSATAADLVAVVGPWLDLEQRTSLSQWLIQCLRVCSNDRIVRSAERSFAACPPSLVNTHRVGAHPPAGPCSDAVAVNASFGPSPQFVSTVAEPELVVRALHQLSLGSAQRGSLRQLADDSFSANYFAPFGSLAGGGAAAPVDDWTVDDVEYRTLAGEGSTLVNETRFTSALYAIQQRRLQPFLPSPAKRPGDRAERPTARTPVPMAHVPLDQLHQPLYMDSLRALNQCAKTALELLETEPTALHAAIYAARLMLTWLNRSPGNRSFLSTFALLATRCQKTMSSARALLPLAQSLVHMQGLLRAAVVDGGSSVDSVRSQDVSAVALSGAVSSLRDWLASVGSLFLDSLDTAHSTQTTSNGGPRGTAMRIEDAPRSKTDVDQGSSSSRKRRHPDNGAAPGFSVSKRSASFPALGDSGDFDADFDLGPMMPPSTGSLGLGGASSPRSRGGKRKLGDGGNSPSSSKRGGKSSLTSSRVGHRSGPGSSSTVAASAAQSPSAAVTGSLYAVELIVGQDAPVDCVASLCHILQADQTPGNIGVQLTVSNRLLDLVSTLIDPSSARRLAKRRRPPAHGPFDCATVLPLIAQCVRKALRFWRLIAHGGHTVTQFPSALHGRVFTLRVALRLVHWLQRAETLALADSVPAAASDVLDKAVARAYGRVHGAHVHTHLCVAERLALAALLAAAPPVDALEQVNVLALGVLLSMLQDPAFAIRASVAVSLPPLLDMWTNERGVFSDVENSLPKDVLRGQVGPSAGSNGKASADPFEEHVDALSLRQLPSTALFASTALTLAKVLQTSRLNEPRAVLLLCQLATRNRSTLRCARAAASVAAHGRRISGGGDALVRNNLRLVLHTWLLDPYEAEPTASTVSSVSSGRRAAADAYRQLLRFPWAMAGATSFAEFCTVHASILVPILVLAKSMTGLRALATELGPPELVSPVTLIDKYAASVAIHEAMSGAYDTADSADKAAAFRESLGVTTRSFKKRLDNVKIPLFCLLFDFLDVRYPRNDDGENDDDDSDNAPPSACRLVEGRGENEDTGSPGTAGPSVVPVPCWLTQRRAELMLARLSGYRGAGSALDFEPDDSDAKSDAELQVKFRRKAAALLWPATRSQAAGGDPRTQRQGTFRLLLHVRSFAVEATTRELPWQQLRVARAFAWLVRLRHPVLSVDSEFARPAVLACASFLQSSSDPTALCLASETLALLLTSFADESESGATVDDLSDLVSPAVYILAPLTAAGPSRCGPSMRRRVRKAAGTALRPLVEEDLWSTARTNALLDPLPAASIRAMTDAMGFDVPSSDKVLPESTSLSLRLDDAEDLSDGSGAGDDGRRGRRPVLASQQPVSPSSAGLQVQGGSQSALAGAVDAVGGPSGDELPMALAALARTGGDQRRVFGLNACLLRLLQNLDPNHWTSAAGWLVPNCGRLVASLRRIVCCATWPLKTRVVAGKVLARCAILMPAQALGHLGPLPTGGSSSLAPHGSVWFDSAINEESATSVRQAVASAALVDYQMRSAGLGGGGRGNRDGVSGTLLPVRTAALELLTSYAIGSATLDTSLVTSGATTALTATIAAINFVDQRRVGGREANLALFAREKVALGVVLGAGGGRWSRLRLQRGQEQPSPAAATTASETVSDRKGKLSTEGGPALDPTPDVVVPRFRASSLVNHAPDDSASVSDAGQSPFDSWLCSLAAWVTRSCIGDGPLQCCTLLAAQSSEFSARVLPLALTELIWSADRKYEDGAAAVGAALSQAAILAANALNASTHGSTVAESDGSGRRGTSRSQLTGSSQVPLHEVAATVAQDEIPFDPPPMALPAGASDGCHRRCAVTALHALQQALALVYELVTTQAKTSSGRTARTTGRAVVAASNSLAASSLAARRKKAAAEATPRTGSTSKAPSANASTAAAGSRRRSISAADNMAAAGDRTCSPWYHALFTAVDFCGLAGAAVTVGLPEAALAWLALESEVITASESEPTEAFEQVLWAATQALNDADSLNGLASRPTARTLRARAALYEVEGDWASAAAAYDELLRANPQSPGLVLGLVRSLEQLGQHLTARNVLQWNRAAARDPDPDLTAASFETLWRAGEWLPGPDALATTVGPAIPGARLNGDDPPSSLLAHNQEMASFHELLHGVLSTFASSRTCGAAGDEADRCLRRVDEARSAVVRAAGAMSAETRGGIDVWSGRGPDVLVQLVCLEDVEQAVLATRAAEREQLGYGWSPLSDAVDRGSVPFADVEVCLAARCSIATAGSAEAPVWLTYARQARHSGQLARATSAVSRARPRVPLLSAVPAEVRLYGHRADLEEAKISWLRGEHERAVAMVRRVADGITAYGSRSPSQSPDRSLSLSPRPGDERPKGSELESDSLLVAADAYASAGRWIAANRSDTAAVARECLVDACSILDHHALKRRPEPGDGTGTPTKAGVRGSERVRKLAAAHLTLAQHMDGLYETMQAKFKSPEWASLRRQHEKCERELRRAREMVSNPPPRHSKHDVRVTVITLERQVNKDQNDVRKMHQDCDQYLMDALRGYADALRLGTDGGRTFAGIAAASPRDLRAAFRLGALWLGNVEKGPVHDLLAKLLPPIAETKFVPLFYQLAGRLGATGGSKGGRSSADAFQTVLSSLLVRVCAAHVHETVFHLIALSNGKRVPATNRGASRLSADEGKIVAALHLLDRVAEARPSRHAGARAGAAADDDLFSQFANALRSSASGEDGGDGTNGPPLSEVVAQSKRVSDAYIFLSDLPADRAGGAAAAGTAKNKRSGKGAGGAGDGLPVPKPIALLRDLAIPVLTATENGATGVARIQRFADTYTLADGLSVPKVLECYGDDGRRYRQLVKSKDDLRQDAVMQQLFGVVNSLFAGQRRAFGGNSGGTGTGDAVGGGDGRSGGSVGGSSTRVRTYRVVPLSPASGVLEWVANTIPLGVYLVGHHRQPELGAHWRYRPGDIRSTDFRARLDGTKAENRLVVYLQSCRQFQPVMRHFFLERWAPSPAAWLAARTRYARSLAASSMIGYVVGLGDRHVSNILLDELTAEVVHIDQGVAFEQGKLLRAPEVVPFRLTRDLVDGLGVSGTEGVFRRCCERSMRVFRDNHEIILAVLEVLLIDPLYNWSLTPIDRMHKQRPDNVENNDTDESRSELPGDGSDDGDDSDDEGDGRNAKAMRALALCKQKLQGFEFGQPLSITGQVKQLISEATAPENLCQLFPGWSPWL